MINLWLQRHWNLNCLLSRENLLLCDCHCFLFWRTRHGCLLFVVIFFSVIVLCFLKILSVMSSFSISWLFQFCYCPFLNTCSLLVKLLLYLQKRFFIAFVTLGHLFILETFLFLLRFLLLIWYVVLLLFL